MVQVQGGLEAQGHGQSKHDPHQNENSELDFPGAVKISVNKCTVDAGHHLRQIHLRLPIFDTQTI
jgi:hypothetical protein